MTKNKHGGRRIPGPGKRLGRPPTGKPRPVQISLWLPAELLEALDRQNRDISRNQLIIRAIEAFLK